MSERESMEEGGRDTSRKIPTTKRPRRFRLPGAVLALLYVAVCLSVILLASVRRVAPMERWELAAAALGMAGLMAMAVQFVTSGRFQSVSGHLGIDKIMTFHKVAALWVLLALALHPLFYVLPTWMDNPALGAERLTAYLTLPHYRSGIVALAALAALVLTSILRNRLPWPYEIWRASHIVFGLTAAGAGLHHALTAGRFSAVGPVHWLWWLTGLAVATVIAVLHGWRWLKLHRRPWRLASVRKLADRMWEVDIQPEPENPPWPYRAGQFVWMTVGRRRAPLFDHPFSIADSPARPGLSLIIKEVGDFTRTVGTIAPGTPVGIDGPHGEFVLEEDEDDGVLLLAGGVGIAPIMGLLRDMVARRDARPVRLAYAAGRPDNFACIDEIEAAKNELDLRVILVSEEGAEGWTGVTGRLDGERLRQLLDGLDPERTRAYICGPGPMVTAVSDTLLNLGLPMKNIDYERFDYGGAAASRQDRRDMAGYLAIGAALAAGTGIFALTY
jgi:predicted ferric reductase